MATPRKQGTTLVFLLICSLFCIRSRAYIPSKQTGPIKKGSTVRPERGLPSLKENIISRTLQLQKKNNADQEDSIDDMVTQEQPVSFLGMPESTAKSLSLLLFSQFILFIGVGAVIPTIPLYGKAIGLSSAANGLVISAPALASLLLSKSAGNFADIARKPAMLWGMLIIAISDFGTAMAPSIIPLVVARLGLGAGRIISESGERGMLADLAATIPELRGRALSIQQVVIALGIAIGAPAGGFIVEQFGPRASFLCVTAAASIALLLYSLLEETISITDEKPTLVQSMHSSEDFVQMQDGMASNNADWGELIKDPNWRSLSLYEVGAKFGYAAKLASIPIIAAATLPGGAVGAGSLISAAGLSGLVGGPVGGFLSDRLGSKETVLLSGVISGFALVSIPFALQMNTPDFLPNGSAFIASVLIWSTSVSAQVPASNAYAQEIAPPGSTATAMGLPRASGDAVFLVAPFLLGYISDSGAADGIECAFAGFCGLVGVAALAIGL